jgi:hypothetical protein
MGSVSNMHEYENRPPTFKDSAVTKEMKKMTTHATLSTGHLEAHMDKLVS